MKVIHCKTARKFLDTLSPHSSKYDLLDKSNFWVFRGQINANDHLYPSALRAGNLLLKKINNGRKPKTYLEQITAEAKALICFLNYVDDMGYPVPEDGNEFTEIMSGIRRVELASDKLCSWLDTGICAWLPSKLHSATALAQHHGIPTRLLDWTYNPYSAAYFAADGESKRRTSGEEKSRICVYALRFCSTVHSKGVTLIRIPYAGNQNLLAQQGVFTMHSSDVLIQKDHLNKLLINTALENVITGNELIKYTLPNSESIPLLALLAKHRITSAKIFPNLSGAALAARNEIFLNLHVT